MKTIPVRATAACVACWLSVGGLTSAHAQDPAVPDASGASRGSDNAALADHPELSGAENLVAAKKAVELMARADALNSQGKKLEADALNASILEAKVAAFHLPEFEKTLKRAEANASRADARATEAKAAAEEAAVRLRKVTTALDAAKKSADKDEVEAATKELKDAEKEHATAKEAESAAVDTANEAQIAIEHAKGAVKTAQSAATLADARAGIMEEAMAQPPAAASPAPGAGSAAATAAELQTRINALKIEAFDKWLAARSHLKAYEAKKVEARKTKEAADDAAPSTEATLANGGRLSWGLAASLLRFQTQRSERLPGRVRSFRPRLEFVPGEVGFQFLLEPAAAPWRVQLKNGETLQLMSWGGLLLASLGEDEALERGSLSIAATLAFFENVIGFGAGFDLYRGIPVLGSSGTPGGDTAFTGVLAWALAHEGEVTAENAFFVVTFNLSSLTDVLTGKENGQ